ncbi:MAG: hypothetical protein SWX82_16355, partial [Cyanobacteriota bacterium]|nr:hypothetical protein [Cyanobacteriota bacterium]
MLHEGGDRLLPTNHSHSNFYSNLPPIGIDTWQGENILNSEYEVTENLSSFEQESHGGTDILIGSNIDATSVVENALPMVQDLLQNFSSKADFKEQLNLAFGDSYDVSKADVLIDSWQDKNLGFLPEIKIISEDEINGAKGAFVGETETIYLAEEFVEDHVGDVGAIVNVIVEEFGHYIDGEINSFDAPGDEGEIFASFVLGEELSDSELLGMKVEDDGATVLLNGDIVTIEQANVSWTGGSGDWYNPRKWSGGKVPKSNDNVTVETFGKNIKISFSKGNPNIRDLFLGANDAGSLTLNGLTNVGNDTDILAEGKNSVVKLPDLKTFSGKDVFQPSSITVRDGGKIEANKLATMTQVDLYADNSNLQLPAVNNFTGIDDTVVKATNEGKLTLGAKTISGDVDITATGEGSVVNLSRATGFQGKDVFRPSFIKAENDGTVKANKLKTIKQVDLYSDNSNLQLPAVNNFTGIDDTVVRATNEGKLTLGAKTISGDVDIT